MRVEQEFEIRICVCMCVVLAALMSLLCLPVLAVVRSGSRSLRCAATFAGWSDSAYDA